MGMFDDFKFRCHYLGSVVSVPKTLTDKQEEELRKLNLRLLDKGNLTDAMERRWIELRYKKNQAATYVLTPSSKKLLQQIVFTTKHGREFWVENKYFKKGLDVEKDSRDMLSDYLGVLLVECTKRRTNNWVSGLVDVDPTGMDKIIDIKNAFNLDSFIRHKVDNNIEHYKRQLDSYMDLWEKDKSEIVWTLMDSPYQTITDEIMRNHWQDVVFDPQGNIMDAKIKDVVKIVQNHIFSYEYLEMFCHFNPNIHIEWFMDFKEIQIQDRIHIVKHEYDPKRIEQRNEVLKLAREYMNSIG